MGSEFRWFSLINSTGFKIFAYTFTPCTSVFSDGNVAGFSVLQAYFNLGFFFSFFLSGAMTETFQLEILMTVSGWAILNSLCAYPVWPSLPTLGLLQVGYNETGLNTPESLQEAQLKSKEQKRRIKRSSLYWFLCKSLSYSKIPGNIGTCLSSLFLGPWYEIPFVRRKCLYMHEHLPESGHTAVISSMNWFKVIYNREEIL